MMNLKYHLNNFCDHIWGQLKTSQELGISQGEETVTDNLLLYLASQRLSSIKIIKTPKNAESTTGTDWEWWIGNDQSGFLRYAIQAKKLDMKTNKYKSLKQKVGKGSSFRYQHEILEDYANANQAIPLYAFYNYIDKVDYSKAWNCNLELDISKLGCTVTPLKNVKSAISSYGSRTFDKIHQFQETIPLRCLAMCPAIMSFTDKYNEDKYIPHLDRIPKIYENPWHWISEIGHLKSFKDVKSNLYNHDLGYYPKRILVIETDNSILR